MEKVTMDFKYFTLIIFPEAGYCIVISKFTGEVGTYSIEDFLNILKNEKVRRQTSDNK